MSNILNVDELYFNSLSWRVAVARVVGTKDTNNGTNGIDFNSISWRIAVARVVGRKDTNNGTKTL